MEGESDWKLFSCARERAVVLLLVPILILDLLFERKGERAGFSTSCHRKFAMSGSGEWYFNFEAGGVLSSLVQVVLAFLNDAE